MALDKQRWPQKDYHEWSSTERNLFSLFIENGGIMVMRFSSSSYNLENKKRKTHTILQHFDLSIFILNVAVIQTWKRI